MPHKVDKLPKNWVICTTPYGPFKVGFRYRYLRPTGVSRIFYRVLPDLGSPKYENLATEDFEWCFTLCPDSSELSKEQLLRFLDQHLAEALKPFRVSAKLALGRWLLDVQELLFRLDPEVRLPFAAKYKDRLCRKTLATAFEVVAKVS